MKSFLWLLVFCHLAFCLTANTTSVDPNTAFGIGPEYSYTKRSGYYDFPEIHKSQLLKRSDLNMIGGVLIKRGTINDYLRFQAGLDFEMGSVTDDTLLLSSASLVKFTFFHIGLEPQLQFPLSTAGRTRPYLLAGGGINYVYTKNRTYFLDNGMQVIWTDLPSYIRSGCFSIYATAGVGVDYALTRSAMVSIWYSFMYGQPVRYELKDNFPLSAQKYHETFFSNRFHATLLFDFR